jgi:hypothetical protein
MSYLPVVRFHLYSFLLPGLLPQTEPRETRTVDVVNWILYLVLSADLNGEATLMAASVGSTPRQLELGTGSTATNIL